MDGARAAARFRSRRGPPARAAARQQLADGIDPLDARKTERAKQATAAAKSITFEQAAQQYFNFHERKWVNAKYRAQFLSSLRDLRISRSRQTAGCGNRRWVCAEMP